MQFVLLIIGISNTVLFLSAVYYVGRHINQCPQNPKNWPIGVPRSPMTVTGMTLPPHIEARYNIKRRAPVNSQPTTSFPPTTRVQASPTPCVTPTPPPTPPPRPPQPRAEAIPRFNDRYEYIFINPIASPRVSTVD